MTHEPWSPNGIMKSIIRTKSKWLSENQKALKGFFLSLVSIQNVPCFFSSSVGMTLILAGYLPTLDDVTLTSVGH